MGFVRYRRSSRGRTLAAALLGTTFLVGLAGPALADSHLESENSELRSQIEELRQEVEILKNLVLQQNKKNMEQDESIVQAAEPAAPSKMAKSGKDNVSLSVYGQVNRMALYADDGKDSRLLHADNDASSTRVGFKGKAKLDDEWSAGATIEVQIESNSSAKVTMDQDTKAEDAKNFPERKLEVWFKSKELGKLSLGQGSTASDGTIEEDLSGRGDERWAAATHGRPSRSWPFRFRAQTPMKLIQPVMMYFSSRGATSPRWVWVKPAGQITVLPLAGATRWSW